MSHWDTFNEHHSICFHGEIRKISVLFGWKMHFIWSYVTRRKIRIGWFDYIISISHLQYHLGDMYMSTGSCLQQDRHEEVRLRNCQSDAANFVIFKLFIIILNFQATSTHLAITCICVGAKCCNPQKIKSLLTYYFSQETSKRITGKQYRHISDATEDGIWSGSTVCI